MRIIFLRIVAVLAAVFAVPQAARSGEAHWPDTLTIGTGSPGGTYYDYGEGLAKLLTRKLDVSVFARATEGPTENIKLLEAGEIQLAFVSLGIAQQAWNGSGEWTGGKQFRAMRAVFPMYDTPFQFLVLQESGIRSVSEMSGKRIGVGPAGGTAAAYFPEFFRLLNVPVSLAYGEWAELAAQVHERKLDVLAGAAGVPFPSFIELEAKDKVRYVAFTANEIAALRLAMPELTPSRVPAGTYPSLLRSYQTIGLFNFAIAHAQLPDDLVYHVVRAVFENQEEMMEANAAAAETIPANIERNSFLPLHPGAIRYYRQIGRAGQTD